MVGEVKSHRAIGLEAVTPERRHHRWIDLVTSVARSGTIVNVADHYRLRLASGTKQRLADRARRARLPVRSLV